MGMWANQQVHVAIALAALVSLTGCEWDNTKNQGSNSGANPPSSQDREVSGFVSNDIDGTLINAEVCLDLNNNGNCDPHEQTTRTDINGDFVLNPPADVNPVPVVINASAGETTSDVTGRPIETSYTDRVSLRPGSSGEVRISEQSDDFKVIDGRAGTSDGYYQDATVCADLDGNGTCDPEEPYTTTGPGGEFELNVPGDTETVDLIVVTEPGVTVNEGSGPVTVGGSQTVTVDVDGSEQEITLPPPTSETTVIEGKAGTSDGYYQDATVCADLNGNGVCDPGEPTTTTGPGGEFELSVPEGTETVDLIIITEPGVTVNEGSGPVTVGGSQTVTVDVDGSEQEITLPPPSPSDPGNPGNPGDPGTPGEDGDPVSGQVMTGNGYLSDSRVCADLNRNGMCDSNEPTTTSGASGRFELEVPTGSQDFDLLAQVIAGETVNETTAQTESENYLLRSTYNPDEDDQVISPLTDLVVAEMDKMATPNLDIARDVVASQLGTSGDVMSDYLADQESDNPLTAENAERLQRISELVATLKQAIESTISPSDRSNSELTEKQIQDRINEQVQVALPDLVADADASLQSGEPFSAVDILNDPKYDDSKGQPSLERPSLADMAIQERILAAMPNTPYFYQDGYERKAVLNAETINVSIYPHPNNPGKLYYEAVHHRTKSTDIDNGTVDAYLTLPRYTSRTNLSHFNAPSGHWCSSLYGDLYYLNCHYINLNPAAFTALTWSGQAWRSTTLRRGLAAERMIVENHEDGSILSATRDGGLASVQTFGEFNLEGLDGKAIVNALLGDQLPRGSLIGRTTTTNAPSGAKAWTYAEESSHQLTVAEWPTGSSSCNGPGVPARATVGSCNLVYGYTPHDFPATTFDNMMYPAGAVGTAFTGAVVGDHAEGAVRVEGPGGHIYVMRLFGTISAGSGAIQIDRQIDENTWQTVSTSGTWEHTDQGFPHIRLTLPDAFNYRIASGYFRAGRPIMFERAGYVRHGWLTGTDVDIETLFGRRAIKFAVNSTALDTIHNALIEMNLLEAHPYFWGEYQNYWGNDAD